MSETVSKEVLLLLAEYENSDFFARGKLARKNPRIDFEKLMADTDLVERAKALKKVEPEVGNAPTVANSRSGNNWIGILEGVIWIFFFISIVASIASAIFAADIFGGAIAFVIFIVSAASAFILLAVIMVFLTMAKDISRTAKDTAEIKEILKGK